LAAKDKKKFRNKRQEGRKRARERARKTEREKKRNRAREREIKEEEKEKERKEGEAGGDVTCRHHFSNKFLPRRENRKIFLNSFSIHFKQIFAFNFGYL
jgi:hypothetical protein